jgi:catechol 2,3-dioxygenase-like lactoylglutathione lyase family enzyme
MRRTSVAAVFALLLPMFLAGGCSAQETPVTAGPVLAMKTRIDTNAFDESLTFYRDIIGLPLVSAWDEAGDRGVILGGDGGYVELGFVDTPTTDMGGLSLQFQVDDIEAFAVSVGDRWDHRGPEVRPWGSIYVYLTDPNGVAIIVFEGEI